MCTSFQTKWTILTFLAQICPKMDSGWEIQKTNVGIRISIVQMPCVPIFRKNWQFDFFGPNLDLRIGISKIYVRIRNLNFQDTMCANFQLKRTTLTFLAQICPKRKLGFEIQETNVGIRISILEIPCVPIFRQNRQLWTFWPKFAQKGN